MHWALHLVWLCIWFNPEPHADRIGDFYCQLSMNSSSYGRLSFLKVMMILHMPTRKPRLRGKSGHWNFYTSFDEYVDKELVLVLTSHLTPPQVPSLYSTHLRQWFDVLKRDRILILSYHELISDPTIFHRRIEGFLGMSSNNGKSKKLTTKTNVKSFPGKVSSCCSRNK